MTIQLFGWRFIFSIRVIPSPERFIKKYRKDNPEEARFFDDYGSGHH